MGVGLVARGRVGAAAAFAGVTAITGDATLIDPLVAEPTVGNVYCGHHPSGCMRRNFRTTDFWPTP
ncbi:hypothetical protein [Mycobacterium sp. E2479]|uniref:hypothetical protein n=1 Tax=Mycobacterium sp. E2479 TaxID=1834134 RepID=UPI000801FECB|nr:hypothetical protein [Mycobacterium sp. E2479]OBH59105.1 hypothetical protein A5686_02985 [Mycobacterium sp. E2479]